MKKFSCLAVMAAAVIVMTAFTGCGLFKSEPRTQQTETTPPEEPAVKIIDETDFMSFIFEEDGTNYLHMTLDELNEKTGNAYVGENALEYDMDYDYATYDYGELDGLFCGRAKFDCKLPVRCQLNLTDGKITKITYIIDEGDADVKSVCESLSACLKDNLPEDYNAEYDRMPQGKDSAVFANTVDGYVFEVRHDQDDGYPAKMSIETYKDRYGME